MKCINFDRAFERYMAGWMKENSEKYKDDMDVIEDMMPDVYLEFLQKPADFLDGAAPQDYFEQFDDADMLVNWLCDYIVQGVPVPDLLLERITSLGEQAEKSLLAQPEGFAGRSGNDRDFAAARDGKQSTDAAIYRFHRVAGRTKRQG